MATYSAIANSEIDADSPITAALMSKYRDNMLAMHKYIRRSGAGTTVDNSTALIDDGTLEFTGAASTVYEVKIVAYFANGGGATNAGVRTAIDIPADATISVIHTGVANSDTATESAGGDATARYFTTTDDDPFIFRTATSAECINATITLDALVVMVSAGSVKLRYACGAAVGAGNTVTIQAGSYLTYRMVETI